MIFCNSVMMSLNKLPTNFQILLRPGLYLYEIFVFTTSWLPYLSKMDDMLQVLHRMFPFSRGLYEDKVANVWCTASVVVKLRQWMTLQSLMSLATVSTLVATLPSCVHLLLNPTPYCFLLALVS